MPAGNVPKHRGHNHYTFYCIDRREVPHSIEKKTEASSRVADSASGFSTRIEIKTTPHRITPSKPSDDPVDATFGPCAGRRVANK
jgi:hypothetical protein